MDNIIACYAMARRLFVFIRYGATKRLFMGFNLTTAAECHAHFVSSFVVRV